MSIGHLLITGLLSAFTSSNNPTSTPSNETYTTTTNNHCKVLNQNPQPNETATWNGNCINGFANGKGTLQWYEDGKKTDVVIATFRDGKKTGKGKYIYANDDVYEGDYLNGKKHGKGKYNYAQDSVYEGDWFNNKKQGKGKITWKNGSNYIGGWFNDYPNGFGKSTLVKNDNLIDYWKRKNQGHWQGDVYIVQGIFKDGTLEIACSSPKDCAGKQNPLTKNYITSTDSHCKVSNPTPKENETITWSGECVNGFANGKGTVQWYQNGKKTSTFIGSLRNGEMHGKGKILFNNGNSYLGNFKQNMKNGYGKLTLVNDDETIKAINSWKKNNRGHWQGDVYIVQGIFKDGTLEIACSSPENCQQKGAKSD